MATPNRFELEQWGRQAARAYLDDGVPLNNSIAKVASMQGFTRHHVERVVQSANQIVNGLIVKEAKVNKTEPRLAFDRANSDAVMEKMAKSAPEEKARMAKQASRLDDLYRLPKSGSMEKTASVDVLEGMFPGESQDPFDAQRGPIPEGLGHAFLFNREAAENMAKIASYDYIKVAVDELEHVLQRSRTDAALLIDVGAFGLDKMAELIDREILNKTHPEHLKAWTKHAELSDDVQSTVERMIDDRVEKLAVYVPKDAPAMPDAFVVNREHPLMKVAGELEQVAKNKATQDAMTSQVEDAIAAAKGALRDAALEQTG